MQAINPTTTSAWSKLVELSEKHQSSTIAALFDQSNRFERYSRSFQDILVDFSKNRISDEDVGGTYLTFLNSITNFGNMWCSSMVLFLMNYIDYNYLVVLKII